MSIFEEMHSSPEFGSWVDYEDLLRQLDAVIARGLVKEITPSSDLRHGWSERWFIENQSGVVFRLLSPDPPARGEWFEVELAICSAPGSMCAIGAGS
jgi:hypothetical protein